MVNLQFGSYVFHHNPIRIEILNASSTANHFLPFIGSKIEFMGLNARVIRIEGEFFGSTALDALNQYTELETLFKEKNKGMLFVPYKKPFYAIFTKLNMLAKGDGKVIAYSAEFAEDNSKAVSEVIYV